MQMHGKAQLQPLHILSKLQGRFCCSTSFSSINFDAHQANISRGLPRVITCRAQSGRPKSSIGGTNFSILDWKPLILWVRLAHSHCAWIDCNIQDLQLLVAGPRVPTSPFAT
jgi:hypothetical protein